MRSKLINIFLIVLTAFNIIAAQTLLPRLGEQRAGTAAVTFLKIGIGARANAMGGAYAAMADDGSATYWNPAGLVQIGKNELLLSHVDWLVDVDFEYIGYVHQMSKRLGLGAFIGYLHFADMPVTTEYYPYGNGEYFSYNDLAAGLSAALKMTDRFSFGITIKYVHETLADLRMNGVLLDFGTYYWTGYKSLRLAAAMRNFGTDLQPSGTYLRRKEGRLNETTFQSFSPPTLFTLGAAMDVYQHKKHVLTASMQMNHPMDDQENFVFGAEYSFRRLVLLRAGYRANMDENRLTFGAGAVVKLSGKKVKIDYAYADFTHLTLTQQFSFGFEF